MTHIHIPASRTRASCASVGATSQAQALCAARAVAECRIIAARHLGTENGADAELYALEHELYGQADDFAKGRAMGDEKP